MFRRVFYVAVSAHSGNGLAVLAKEIAGILEQGRDPRSVDNPVLTRERHRVALLNARTEVAAFLDICENERQLPAIVAAVHLQCARGYLEELVGVLDVEDVLDRVFSSFCVGK